MQPEQDPSLQAPDRQCRPRPRRPGSTPSPTVAAPQPPCRPSPTTPPCPPARPPVAWAAGEECGCVEESTVPWGPSGTSRSGSLAPYASPSRVPVPAGPAAAQGGRRGWGPSFSPCSSSPPSLTMMGREAGSRAARAAPQTHDAAARVPTPSAGISAMSAAIALPRMSGAGDSHSRGHSRYTTAAWRRLELASAARLASGGAGP